MKKYKEGDTVIGIVTGFEKYGIFLAFEDGYSGLIHISEVSNHFVRNVMDYAELGDEIPCVILECDDELKKIKCSIKDTDYAKEKEGSINHGFALLKKQLPIWMEEKLNDIREEGKYR